MSWLNEVTTEWACRLDLAVAGNGIPTEGLCDNCLKPLAVCHWHSEGNVMGHGYGVLPPHHAIQGFCHPNCYLSLERSLTAYDIARRLA